MDEQPQFFYDSGCGFCRTSARTLQRWAPSVRFMPASPDDTHLPPLVRSEITRHAMLIDAHTCHRGHAAIACTLRGYGRSPVLRFLGRLCLLPGAGVVYRWVARNRSTLSRVLGTSAN